MTDTDLRHAHLVRCEGTRLVGTDHVRAAESFDTREVAYNGILLRHFLSSERETRSNHSSKSFWNSSNGEGNCNLEVVHRTLQHTMVRGVPEVPDVHEPDQDTDDSDDLRKHVAKVVKLALQRSLLADLRRNRLVNIANGSLLASKDDDSSAFAIYDRGALSWSRIRCQMYDRA